MHLMHLMMMLEGKLEGVYRWELGLFIAEVQNKK